MRLSITYVLSAFLALFLSCKTPGIVVKPSLPVIQVPEYLDTRQLAPVRHVEWFVNGVPFQMTAKRELLITSSGSLELVGAFYLNGVPDTVRYNITALAPDNNCLVAVHTSKGTMVADLSVLAPRHSDHFEELVVNGYYDSLIFHRVIPGFVIQGGDANQSVRKNGQLPLALRELNPEFNTELNHYKGALAMARMPDDVNPEKRSSPDQFYIVQGAPVDAERLEELSAESGRTYKSYQKQQYFEKGGSPQLDGEYTVFGYVKMGFPVLDSIALTPTAQGDLPIDTIIMKLEMVR